MWIFDMTLGNLLSKEVFITYMIQNTNGNDNLINLLAIKLHNCGLILSQLFVISQTTTVLF